MLEHAHTTVGCAQINSNSRCFRHFHNCKTSNYTCLNETVKLLNINFHDNLR
jgi:hypothetical protein